MPPRRAQLGGPFGGGVQATERPSTNWSGIIDAVSNGTATLLQQAAMRKVARDNAAASIARQQQQDRIAEEQRQMQRDQFGLQKDQFQRQIANDTAAHDQTWETNARTTAKDAAEQANKERDFALRQRELDRKANAPKAPVPGTPEYFQMKRKELQMGAEFRQPEAPHIIMGDDGPYQVKNGAVTKLALPGQNAGSATVDGVPVQTSRGGVAAPRARSPGDNLTRGMGLQPAAPAAPAVPSVAQPEAPHNPFAKQGFGRIPPAFAKSISSLETMNKALDTYETALNAHGTALMTGSNTGAADVNGAYMAAVMQLKEANDLGVLNGRDYELLNKQLQGPIGPSAIYHGKDVIGAQIKQVRKYLNSKRVELYKAYGQHMPAGAAQPGTSVPSLNQIIPP